MIQIKTSQTYKCELIKLVPLSNDKTDTLKKNLYIFNGMLILL